ncbi:MAG: fimbrial biogenesis outer membrane usher protein [Actinobacteria bacterium]|nr:fimbrial biogenesis outer membrane usher protein [Actinomycetota bacterium]NCX76145.1 fimbrial biogenesis outer membrane usher protein [Actinomycetota bacterium]NDA36599.1 fimbrial biogenesis outer membrane usher protein [Actinomycetota bacterium]NKA16473.1 fimbrial biogenesis outer membrane usher protein [Candidatus Fonsibacter sp. PEL55]
MIDLVINGILLAASSLLGVDDVKKIIFKEDKYEINRSIDQSKNKITDGEKKNISEQEKEQNKNAQRIPEQEPVRVKTTSCATDAEILLVDVSINLLQITEPIRVEKLPNGSIVLPELVFKELKLIPKNEKTRMSDCSYGYVLNTNSGLTYSFNAETFALDIRVPIESFELNVFAKKESYKLKPETVSPGAFTNYQLYATQTKTNDSISGVLDVTGFNKLGSLTTGAIVNKDNTEMNVIRTSSYYQKDLPDKMQSFVLGDTVNSDGNWSRSANYFGVKWSRNFSTQPGYIYTPNPIISGSAALPSVVDVYVNNQKTFSQKINPGPFDITHLPVPGNGVGQVNLVIKDLLGNEQIVTKNFYQSPILLAKGENDFSLESGFLRKNYGTKNSDYQDGFISGTYVHGITNSITTRGRFELQPDRQAAGGDVAFTIGNFALLQTSVASSNENIRGNGNQYGINIENLGQFLKTSVGVKRFDKEFSQFASSGDETKPKTRANAFVSFPIPLINNNIGIGYINQTNWDSDPFKNVYLSSGFALPYGANLSLSYNKRLDNSNNWGAAIVFSVPLGDLNTRYNHSIDPSGKKTDTYTVSTNVPAGPGMGWSVTNEDLKKNANTNITVNSNAAQYTGQINVKDGITTGKRLGVTGTVGLLDGEIFKSRNIYNSSFAIVKTEGLKDIKIYSQNNMVAITDSKGRAAFPIRPYEKNKIQIKDNEIPLEANTEILEMNPVAYARSGLLVKFPIKISKNALVRINLPNDNPIPAGATVTIDSSKENYIAGRNGEVYLTNLNQTNKLIITWLENKCELNLEVDMQQQQEQIIGPVKCVIKN